MRPLYALGIAFLSLSLGLAAEGIWARHRPLPAAPTAAHRDEPLPTTESAKSWFARIRPRCNALEAAVAIQRNPPPVGRDGAGYAASCYALAGKIDAARALIDALPAAERPSAAGIVFGIGHPVADQGDDESAGPIMELVLAYQPDNFMALYHAGMSQFVLGQHEQAERNMRRFLEVYRVNDIWRSNAEKALRRLAEAK